MRFLLWGSVTLGYLLSVYALPMMWTRTYSLVAARFDLSPEHMALIPMGLNLFAAAFAIPAVLFLVRRSEDSKRTPLTLVLASICAAAGGLLLLGTLRWFANSPTDVAAGIAELSGHSEPELPDLKRGVYQDEELGFTIALPRDWNFLSANAIRRAHVAGANEISRSGSMAIPSHLPEGVQQFLVAKRYPENHPGFNPAIAFASYEKGAMARQGCFSLNSLFDPLASTGPPFRVLYGPSASSVGAFQGREVLLRGRIYETTVSMRIYGFETNSHFITVTLSYERGDDLEAMKAALSSIAPHQ